MIYREAALHSAGQRPQNVTEVFVASRNQDRMPGLFPDCSAEQGIVSRKGARRSLAMYPHVTEFGMPFLLDEVMANLVHQLEVRIESFAKGFGDLLENNQTVQDCIVSAGGNCVQVVA